MAPVMYRNVPMFSGRQVKANSEDPYRTEDAVWSGSTLFVILSTAFERITLL